MCVHASHFSRVRLFSTLWTAAHQAPLFMGFSRQEYWSGLPCPPPGDLFLTQGSNPGLLRLVHWQVDSLPLGPPCNKYLLGTYYVPGFVPSLYNY